MNAETLFLTALGVTAIITVGVIAFLHRPMKRLLVTHSESTEKAGFSVAAVEVLLFLIPFMALFARSSTARTIEFPVLALGEMLWAPILGLIITVIIALAFIASMSYTEPEWRGRVVPRGDLKQLMTRIDTVRGRDIVVDNEDGPADDDKPT